MKNQRESPTIKRINNTHEVSAAGTNPLLVYVRRLKKITTATGLSLDKSFNEQNNMKSPISALCGEYEPRRPIFKIPISNLSLCSRFSFVIVLIVINRLPRNSKVKSV